MSDLFKKLNVLVQASLNDLTGSATRSRRRDAEPKLGAAFDRDVRALRTRVNEAIAYEDQLKKRVRELEAEVDRWDASADEAVMRGDDVAARFAVEQVQRARQRAVIARNDVREHQLVTQELITRVNTLEAALADARRRQGAQTAADESTLPERLNDVLAEARSRMTALSDVLAAKDELTQTEQTPPADQQVIEDDLSQRRRRLSK